MKKYKRWNIKKCHEFALKYNTRYEFKVNANNAYSIACKNNWLNKICSHMPPKRCDWTENDYYNEALIYNTIKDFRKYSNATYNAALKNNYLNKISKHLNGKHKIWTKEEIILEALKYVTKTDFCRNGRGAYYSAWKNKILDEVCQHMISLGNIKLRSIYAIEFNDNYVYVGLSHDINERFSQHMTKENSAVFQHMEKTNKQPNIKQLTNYVNIEEAIEMEKYYVNEYKINKWNLLNKIKTGGLGGNNKFWTLNACRIEALKYKTKVEFIKNSNKAYVAANYHGWISEICSHMINPKIKWTKEKCALEASKYNLKKEYRKKSPHAYDAARRNKWLCEFY